MCRVSLRLAGIRLVIFPTVIFGGVTLPPLLIDQHALRKSRTGREAE
jgi:hypothetical protein